MNPDELSRAISGLFSPEGGGVEEKERAVAAALRDPRNAQAIKAVLEAPEVFPVKLALIESLNKALASGPDASQDGFPSATGELGEQQGETPLLSHVYALLEYFAGYVKAFGQGQPPFITNCICSLYGQQFKALLRARHSVEGLLASLHRHFLAENSQLWEAKCLLKFVYYALESLTLNPTVYGYFEYRKLVAAYEECALPFFLEQGSALARRLCGFAAGGADRDALEALLLGLQVLHRLLCFPFGLSYYEYSAESAGDEVTLVIFPDAYAPLMEDHELVKLLSQVFAAKLSKEISLEVMRILSRMASCRMSLFADEGEKARHKQEFAELFPLLAQNSPLDDRAFQTELMDYGLRCLFVFSWRFVMQSEELAAAWRACWLELGARVVQGSESLADPVLSRYIDFLKRAADNGSGNELATTFIAGYCQHFFAQSTHAQFFPAAFLTPKKFVNSVEKRFGAMRAVYQASGFAGPGALEEAGRALQLAEAGDVAVFATRFSHFLLAFTAWCVKVERRADYFCSESERAVPDAADALCLMCFQVIGRSPAFAEQLRPDLRRVWEMASLFFLEQFLVTLRKTMAWSDELQRFEVHDELFARLCAGGVFRDFAHFFELFVAKILSNFAFKDATLSRYSIMVLKSVVEKTRKALDSSRPNELLSGLAESIFGAAESLLGDARQLKIRSELMQLLPPIFLDDYFDDYIANAQMLLRRLEATGVGEAGPNVPRLLHDVIGLFTTVAHRKIFAAVCRIFYPKVQAWLQAAGAAIMTDQAQVLVLLDFYSVLLDQLIACDTGQAQEVIVQIIADSCSFVGLMAREINDNLRALDHSQLTGFVAEYKKLVKRLLGVFGKLVKFAGLSFLVLHVFGNDVFAEFVRNVLSFTGLITAIVVQHFPQMKEELVLLLGELAPVVAQLALSALQPAEVGEYLQAVFRYFVYCLEQQLLNTQTRGLVDESPLSNTHAVFTALFGELFETERICADRPEKSERVAALLRQTAPLACEFASKAVHFALNFVCSFSHADMFADILFNLLIGYNREGLFRDLAAQFAAHNPSVEPETARQAFEALARVFPLSMKRRAKEGFQQAFAAFLKDCKREKRPSATSVLQFG